MKIQTTDEVRHLNAQIELVDIVLKFAADEITEPGQALCSALLGWACCA